MRYLVLLASIAIQICLGGVYAWSRLADALKEDHPFSKTQTQLIFGITIASFTVAMILAGRLLHRLGPRIVAAIGGMLFAAGYLVAAGSGGSFAVILVGVGVIVGAGIGFGYVCPLTTCVKWFPKHKGLVTGLAVAGFGGGAVLLKWLCNLMFDAGMDVLSVFGWIGGIYGLVVVGSAMLLWLPKGIRTGPVDTPELAIGKVARTPTFWALFAGLFAGTFAGLMVVGDIRNLGQADGLTAATAGMGITMLSIGNTLGRIAWGWIADRLRFATIPVSLAFLAGALVWLQFGSTVAPSFYLATLVVGFGFGGCFVVYAAEVANRFGAEKVATVYPLIFLAYGISGPAGPGTGGWIVDTTGSYDLAIWTSIGVVAGGIVLSSALGMVRRSESTVIEQTAVEPGQ